MSFELWDTDSGNLVEAFDDQNSALVAARELIAANRDVYPAMLTLLAIDERGALSTLASGEALGDMAATASQRGGRRSR